MQWKIEDGRVRVLEKYIDGEGWRAALQSEFATILTAAVKTA